jgi:hypothetical protein
MALVLLLGIVSRVAWPSPPIPVVTTTPLATRASSPPTALTPASSFTIYLPVIGGEDLTSLPAEPTLAPTAQPPTVAPSPTPLQWPEPLAGQTASKLGIHLINNSDPYIMEFIRRVHPRLVKTIESLGWLAEVKAASPDTVTIGRIYGQEETWVGTVDPIAAANAYVANNLQTYRLNPGVDYWEGWNEYVINTPERVSWFTQFEATRACAMQAQGLRAIVGNFGVGWPLTYQDMESFLPALEAVHRCGGIFGLHEYNSPTFQCGVDRNVAGIIPGAPFIGDVAVGYRTLRYRLWYEGLLKPRGLGDLPLALTEVGISGEPPGGPCNDPGSNGAWKGYQEWWVQQGFGPSGPQAYVNLLAWYDSELRKDPYVIGATIFTAGSGWDDFNIHDILIPLAQYEAELK